MPAGKGNAEQIAYWNGEAGRSWTDQQERLDAMMMHIADAGLNAAAPAPGELALDIGCGTGGTALMLADRVGWAGRVVGIDVSSPMLARARARAAEHPLANRIRFIEADAAEVPLTPGSAELLFSRFGVMFFEDAVSAFANLRRGLARHGRLVFVAWRALEENPWAHVPLKAGLAHVPGAMLPAPGAPGTFAFADPARVRAILDGAGFTDVALEPYDTEIVLAPTPAEAARNATTFSALGRLLRGQPEHVRLKVESELVPVFRDYASPAGIRLPAGCWIVTARP